MKRPILSLLVILLSCASVPAADPTYWEDVRPILRKHCTVCHSKKNLQEVEISGGLALDTFESVARNKKPMFTVGKSRESLLYKLLVTSDTDTRMPLGIDPLPAEKIETLARWIDTGAKEGTAPDMTETTTVTLPSRRRKLDVVLKTTTTPPANVLGPAKPAPLQMRLPVGPLSPVTAVRFSPDGRYLATGSYGIVAVWDLDQGKPARMLTSVLGSVNDLQFSPDGKTLAVAGGQPSARGDLRLFSVQDGKLLASLSGHADVVASIDFHPGGKYLASASFDRTVKLWNLATFKEEREYTGHSDFVYAVDFAPDGAWLASASKDRSVKVVETLTGKSMRTFSGMTDDVLAVAVHPDGKSVVSSGLQPGIYWWEVESGERARLQNGHRVAVNEIVVSADGKLIASAGSDSTVKLWDGSSGAVKTSMTTDSIAYAVALSADGKRVAAGCFDGTVRVWDVTSNRHIVTLLSLPPYSGEPEWLALTPEGYASAHPGVVGAASWEMGTQAVKAEDVWKALGRDAELVRSLRGEKASAPTFGK